MDENDMTPDELLQPVLLQIQENGEQGLARLDELLQLYENDTRLHFLRGSVLAGLEQYAEARVAMQKAIDIAPGYAIARFQLGFLELTSGDARAAQSTWLPLLNLPSDNPLNLFVQGLNKLIVDDFVGTIALLEAGIALNTELLPMNKDMGLIVQQAREKLDSQVITEPAEAQEVESGAHFLLKQYSFKDTKH